MELITGFTSDGAIYASYLKEAYRTAQHSPDPSTQVGCVIVNPLMGVIARGCNDLPKGIIQSKDKLEGMNKSIYVEHAERNAIYRCSQSVLSSTGCHAYVTLAPCMDCARALIQSGITQVVSHKEMLDKYTVDSEKLKHIEYGARLLAEAGIRNIVWSGTVFTIPVISVRVRGNLWTP